MRLRPCMRHTPPTPLSLPPPPYFVAVSATSCSFESILLKDELAGLACCPDVESRLVAGGKKVDEAGDDWEVEHGPFEEKVRCLLVLLSICVVRLPVFYAACALPSGIGTCTACCVLVRNANVSSSATEVPGKTCAISAAAAVARQQQQQDRNNSSSAAATAVAQQQQQ